jgi:hypothetical protein
MKSNLPSLWPLARMVRTDPSMVSTAVPLKSRAISPTLWGEIREAKTDVADVIRQTGEHASPRATAAASEASAP